MNNDRYIETVGRRKTSVARVRITPAAKQSFTINDKELAAYFPVRELADNALTAFVVSKTSDKFKITALIKGGGISSQAGALRHALSRALVLHNIELKGALKKAGYLKRDPRAKERRKFGLKKARKAPQWSKR